eukprot:TRINITY_DN63059_c0_g1_i1.p1 TRINITY_DN63059_c0_g1~~TRINITY_DN63059_c0_g1_i1.p1  ORF type:complete len:472 (+),score=71.63 TRINITY_DN63059_c0_g1_i1:84-1499(+)
MDIRSVQKTDDHADAASATDEAAPSLRMFTTMGPRMAKKGGAFSAMTPSAGVTKPSERQKICKPDTGSEQQGARQPDTGRLVELLVSHATQKSFIRVSTPVFAKFRHVKAALGRRLGQNPSGIHLVKKQADSYCAYQDDDFVGETRHITVVGADLSQCSNGRVEVRSEDMDDNPRGYPQMDGVGDALVHVGRPGRSGGVDDDEEPVSSEEEGATTCSPAISEYNVTKLQSELRDRFAEESFQTRLRQIQRRYGHSSSELKTKRNKLLLEVQSKVLPRYGFKGTQEGVFEMMAAMGPYVGNARFKELAEEINQLLGITSPPETWRKLSKVCAKSVALERNAFGSSSTQVEEWPADKVPDFKLFVVGSWNSFEPVAMEWDDGLFALPIEVGSDGWEQFQILKDDRWDQLIYPSMADAGTDDNHIVCGPDASSDQKSWLIGKSGQETATPGACFIICALLDARGSVGRVSWETL